MDANDHQDEPTRRWESSTRRSRRERSCVRAWRRIARLLPFLALVALWIGAMAFAIIMGDFR